MKKHSRQVEMAIQKAGGLRALARELGIAYQAIQDWDEIPVKRVVAVEKITGISRAKLRPDIFLVK